jgi:RNA polymerase sigma-70 factor (ECF subfamily)
VIGPLYRWTHGEHRRATGVERTDEQLARASKEGDSRAFGILVERLRAPLIGYATGLLGRRDDAEELAQETFLIAWQKLGSLRVTARVNAWIYRIAHNLAVKRPKRIRTQPLREDPPQESSSPQDQHLLALLAAVARLSQPHREVISRKHFAGYSGQQIARHLGIPVGTVRSRLSRAYTELRAMLVEQEKG